MSAFGMSASEEAVAIQQFRNPLSSRYSHLGMGQNLVPLVNIKIAGKWMFIPLKMYL